MARWKMTLHARLSGSRLPVYFALVVLLVVLMLILPIYWIYTDKLKNQITRINESLTDQVLSTFDGLLQEVDRMSVRLTENVNVNRFIFLQKNGLFESEEEYQLFLKELYGVITGEQKFYPNIGNIYLYIPRTGVVVTSNATLPLGLFPDQDFIRLVEEGEQPGAWSNVRTTNARQVSGYPIDEDVVTLHRYLTNDGLANDAILFIDVKMSLFKQFERFENNYPLALFITNANQQLIYAETNALDESGLSVGLDRDKMLEKGEFIRTTALSDYNNWNYEVIVPKQWMFAPMQFISRMTFMLAIVVLAFGLLVSVYFSRRFHRPLEAALAKWRKRESYGGNNDGVTAPGSLRDSIQSLVHSTMSYADLLDANRSTIRGAMLLDLLRNNEWPSETEPPVGLVLKREAPFYQVVTCVRDETAELNERDKGLIQYAVHNRVRESFEQEDVGAACGCEIVPVDDNSFGIVLFGLSSEPFGEPSDEDITSHFCKLQKQLRSYPQFAWTFGIGSRYTDEAFVAQSYRESQLAAQYRIYRGKGSVIPFGELKVNDSRLTPASDEWMKYKDKIIAGIRSRDIEQTRRSVMDLCNWIEKSPYGHRNQIEWNRIHYMGYSVFTEIEKLIYDLNMDRMSIYPNDMSFAALMESNPTIVEIRQLLLDTCERMIEYLNAKPSSSKSSFVASVVEYIQQDFGEQQISLDNTADRFGMNPSYLGQLLKKELNRTFLQLLSEVRIERAKQLLVDPAVQIQDVAAYVGYGNRSTFIRIFKSHVGITPSDYRNQMLLEKRGVMRSNDNGVNG
jgi:two-component system response regulator YesN